MGNQTCSRSTLRGPGADSTNERPRTKRPARSDNGETMAGFKLAFSIAAHSEGEEARKLEDFRRVSRQWKMVLGDFTLPGQIDTI